VKTGIDHGGGHVYALRVRSTSSNAPCSCPYATWLYPYSDTCRTCFSLTKV